MVSYGRIRYPKFVLQCFIVLAGLASSLAHAIVNMESVHLGKPSQGFSGNFDLTVDAEYGNTEKASVATGLKLQWAEDTKTSFVLGNYAYGENAGVKNKNKSFVHLRHIRQFEETKAWEALTQFSNNEFTSLKLRALIGGGVRLNLGDISESSAMYLGLGGFYEREKLDVDATSGAEETESAFRGNFYFVAKYQFNNNVSLVSSTYYQPALDEFSDFRAIENASIVSKLTKDLSLKLGIDIQHDSEPPPNVENTDAGVTIGFSVKF